MDPTDPTAKTVRVGLVVLALLALAVSLFTVYASALEAIRTWLEWRWVALARAVFALVVGALAVWVLQRITKARLV